MGQVVSFDRMDGLDHRGRPQPFLPNPILGVIIFVATEVMFFFGLIRAFLVIRASSGTWSPPSNVTLPVYATGFNSRVLVASAVAMHLSLRRIGLQGREAALKMYLVALGCGAFFVLFQGYEWVQLISYGMTMTSGVFGATFFLLSLIHI